MKRVPLWHLPFFSSGDLSGGLIIPPTILGLFATSAVYFSVFHVPGRPVSFGGLAVSSLCLVVGLTLGVFLAKRGKRPAAYMQLTSDELILHVARTVTKIPRAHLRAYEAAHHRQPSSTSVGIWCPTMVIEVAIPVAPPAGGLFAGPTLTITAPGIRSMDPAACTFERAVKPWLHVRDADYQQLRQLLLG